MRQRVVIALALAAEPQADRRRRADHRARRLDPGADHRAAKRLCREHGTAVMLVTHDMGVIAETADRVAVMYAGRIAEIGPVRDVIHAAAASLHRRADGLDPDDRRATRERLAQIDGAMPRLTAIPPGCAFNPRCPHVVRPLPRERPDLLPAGATPRRLLAARRAAAQARAVAAERRCRARRRSTAWPSATSTSRAPWLNRVLERKPRQFLHAVDGVELRRSRSGETLALVGESGCGKSHGRAAARRAVRADRAAAIAFDGLDMRDQRDQRRARALRRRMQMIFQDPYASLNPRWRVRDIVAEPLRAHRPASRTRPQLDDAGRRAAAPGAAWRRPTARSIRTSSPAASASASRSRARWRPSPSSWSATSRPRRSTSRCRRRSSTS